MKRRFDGYKNFHGFHKQQDLALLKKLYGDADTPLDDREADFMPEEPDDDELITDHRNIRGE